ncbi:endonuclease/exonuclease/phosphatase family protein [Streptomyces sp. 21So2-11]|uniref:endonuclease/exonuclease/phosphatase family protein n=1 Tax=Streptomyces sp. 21So2-11 TaxID=3144408 RepID=UPI003219CB24
MLLKVLIQNTGRGGLKTGTGIPQDRWPLLAERISAAQADVALLQELEGWPADGRRQTVRAEHDLDMDVLLAPSRSGLGTGALYRRTTLGRYAYWNADYAKDETHHGLGTAGFNIPGLPDPLAVTSLHCTPYSVDKAIIEVDFAASRSYKLGPYAIIGGDVNYPPQEGPEPDYVEMRPYNLGSRTVLTDPAEKAAPRPDRRVAWKLHANGFRDAAWELYQRTKDAALLAPTGTDDRIDQIWVSAPLVPALVAYTLLDTPEDASDHHGAMITLDTDLIDTTTPWTYR